MKISREAYEKMVQCAEADYPDETCGFVFGDDPDLEVVPMENIQNQLHERDPETFKRDAKTAYYFDPMTMQQVLDEKEKADIRFRSIYHSHPEHDAYFSETDALAAAPFGEPNYPGVVYLVFSVKGGKVVDLKGFDWSDDKETFVEVEVEVEDG